MMKYILLGTAAGLLLSIFLALVIFQELSWLLFINMTFYVVIVLFCISLLALVIQKGFFDVVFYSFRKFSKSEVDSLNEEKEIRKLSEIFSLPYRHIFIVGLILTCIMLIALNFYY